MLQTLIYNCVDGYRSDDVWEKIFLNEPGYADSLELHNAELLTSEAQNLVYDFVCSNSMFLRLVNTDESKILPTLLTFAKMCEICDSLMMDYVESDG